MSNGNTSQAGDRVKILPMQSRTKLRLPKTHDGEVKILVPADPDKLKAWRATPDGIRAAARAKKGKTDFNYGRSDKMGALKKKLMQDQEDGIVEGDDED